MRDIIGRFDRLAVKTDASRSLGRDDGGVGSFGGFRIRKEELVTVPVIKLVGLLICRWISGSFVLESEITNLEVQDLFEGTR